MKISFYLIITTIAFGAFSCENKPAETNTTSAEVKDSIKTDSSASITPQEVTTPELTGYAKIVAQKWKATEFETPTAKLPGDLIDIRFNFKPDGTFEYSEDGKKDTGEWKLSDDGKTLVLSYDKNSVKANMNIKELNDNKMVIAGKEHGMYRTYILAPFKG